jgi:hypothetical protein
MEINKYFDSESGEHHTLLTITSQFVSLGITIMDGMGERCSSDDKRCQRHKNGEDLEK